MTSFAHRGLNPRRTQTTTRGSGSATTRTAGQTAGALTALLTLLVAAPLAAQPAVDRGAAEEKRRLAEEKRKQIEKFKKQKTKETSDQKEERLRMERKAADQRKALTLAQGALNAAARRQNRKGLDLMRQAWALDPRNMDYSFNAAQFAEALKDQETEFKSYAAFMNVAVAEEKNLGPGASQYKTTLLERIAKAQQRLAELRKTLSVGRVTITVQPSSCDVYIDDHMIGAGGGTMECITGQHKVRTDCMGYKPLSQYLNVRVGDANKAVLKPQPIAYYGYLVVKVKPADGVTIFLDDTDVKQRIGKAATETGQITGKGSKRDPFRLHARKWIIRFKKDGYDRWHRRIKIERDRVYVLNAALERMSDTVETSGND